MFSIKDSFVYGFEKLKSNLELCLLSTLLMLAVGSIVNEWKLRFATIFILAAFVLLMIIKIGYTKIFLKIHDGEQAKFGDLFREYQLFWKYIGVSILTCLATIGGLILLIIPGIVWTVRFAFAPIILIDTKSGPVISMKESYKITAGKFWKLLLFWIVIGLFNFLGFMLFMIGLLVTVPVSTLATIHIYRKLTAEKATLMTENNSPQVATA